MDYCKENDSFGDESFHVYREKNKKARAIIDSDSDDSDESFATDLRTESENFSEDGEDVHISGLAEAKQDVNIQDSFSEDEEQEDFPKDEEGVFDEKDIVESDSDEQEIEGDNEQEIDLTLSENAQKEVDLSSEKDEEDIEIIDNSLSIVEVSSEEEMPSSSLKQMTMKSFLIKTSKESHLKQKASSIEKINVGQGQYQEQVKKVSSIESDLLRAKNAMRVIKLENLPDKGKSLVEKEKSLSRMLEEQKAVLANMIPDPEPASSSLNKINIAWDEIEAGVDAVAPRTFGKKGVARFNAEKHMAVETLDSLHKSLETCPSEQDYMDDPQGLRVPLMTHQKRALAWLSWREKQKPSGGLLADDMGLGKTLTMISLIIKSRELGDSEREEEQYRDKYPGGSLVVCPASLINQWSGEVERRTKRGLLGVEVHHGPKRETKAKRLAKHDLVITTYALVLSESEKNGPLFGVRWRRIILDEAHQIRNHRSRTSEAACRLSGKSRWALTGTPVHNKELDMYALLKFLRCTPFDNLQVWKHWVGDKSTGGQMRLHAVISSLMLRRTKAELMENGVLQSLPERKWELVPVKLHKNEMDVYQKVLIFSRTLFAQFLHQRAAKNQDAYDMKFTGAPPDPNGEYFKMRNRLLKLNRVKEVSQHEILVLLLRLRQICCHPSLIKQMLHGDEDLGEAEDQEQTEELNLLEQLNRLNIDDSDGQVVASDESVGLKEASKGFLHASNPVFQSDRRSSKIEALLTLLKEKVSSQDKAIVVSQWTSLLQLVAKHVKNDRIAFDCLDGTIPVHKRMAIVDNFNDPNSETKVLLLSLTAGGVGLNLVGANHLFLLDLHWNPQLENQAQDRIYRMGQTKTIFVYKFMAVDTIEERIKALQEMKLEIADSMLTGSKKVINSKLTLQDLKLLFDFK
ncbi:transcription termination factor 2-like [Tenebrio molitor]|uniref:transcription termination factor 2-like n=1 Tax=Tenebrio molitor TaxID=7067 RepID=UPI003624A8C9